MRKAVARRLLREWSPQVAQFFGVQPRQLTLHFGQTDTAGAAAEANQTTGEITMSRDFLRNATREDLRGNLIHEATHALGVGFGKSSQKVETLADYARYRLNPNEAAYWTPSAQVLAMAKRRDDDMPSGTQGNGPQDGRGNPRRRRNTGAQNSSHAPLLGPSQTFGYAAQMANAQDAYTQALAAIRAQAGGIRGEYKGALSDIRAQRIMGAAETEGAAIERGIIGSSADLSGRAAVVAEAASAKIDARGARNSALGQLRLQQMQAQTTLNSNLLQIQADKRAAQAEKANQQFLEDQMASVQQDYDSMYQDILRRLLAKGKNPAGEDPRASLTAPPPGATGGTIGHPAAFGDYAGKFVDSRTFSGYDPYVGLSRLGTPYTGDYAGKVIRRTS